MTTEDRTQLALWLADSQQQFLAAIDEVVASQWIWKPGPDVWSIGEIAGHVVLSEALLFDGVRRALLSQADPEWEEHTRDKTARIVRVMAPRKGRALAPESLIPKQAWGPDQVRERFLTQRAELTRFLPTLDGRIYECTAEHPFPYFGILNGWQWLIYIPLHTLRHEKQMAEVKALPGYPRL